MTTTTPTTWALLLWGDPDACVDLGAAYAAHATFAARCAADGHEIVGGEELASPSAGRVLRAGSGDVTDGPYAEVTEQLGGFYLIRTGDPEGLLRLAEPLMMDGGGAVELRPVVVHDAAGDVPAADVAQAVAEGVA